MERHRGGCGPRYQRLARPGDPHRPSPSTPACPPLLD